MSRESTKNALLGNLQSTQPFVGEEVVVRADRIGNNKVISEFPQQLSSMGVPFVRFEILANSTATRLEGDKVSSINPEVDLTKTNRANINLDQIRQNIKQMRKTSDSDSETASNKSNDPQFKEEDNLVTRLLEQTPRLQRLERVIGLQMPRSLIVNNEIMYGEPSIGTLEAIAAELGNTQINGVGEGLVAAGKAVGTAVTRNLRNSLINGAGGAVGRALKVAENPRTEKLFDRVERRRFTMDYVFAPKNANEAQIAIDIIKTFRYYSLPELVAGKFYYLYPAEFQVTFFNALGDENLSIPKISQCIIRSVIVNYTPNGVFSAFENGLPTVFELSINLEELEVLDNKRIADGF
ncbi:hypothetical protein [Synechococcus phage BUCT-ZZ01]|nr:hypothetical protein [Synechococcus phage BUCT-ZZ01]